MFWTELSFSCTFSFFFDLLTLQLCRLMLLVSFRKSKTSLVVQVQSIPTALSSSPVTMTSASKTADTSVVKFGVKEELFWVNCNKCGEHIGRTRWEVQCFLLLALLNSHFPSPRIYLTSCGCLVCQDCGPRVLKGGKCLFCRSSTKVSAKPIGPKLTSEAKYFFLPQSAQPSLKVMERTEKFQQKASQEAQRSK